MTTYQIAAYIPNGSIKADTTTPEYLGDAYGVHYSTREEAEDVAEELQDDLTEYGLHPATVYEVEDIERMDVCECGQASGEACDATLRRDAVVTVEWMPRSLRANHEAAGNSGVWPHNGAERLRCDEACADAIVESDPEWSSIVSS